MKCSIPLKINFFSLNKLFYWLLIVLPPLLYTQKGLSQNDSIQSNSSFSNFLKTGKLNFHNKTFAMSTLNNGTGNDFFALGNSVSVHYATPSFYGFNINAEMFWSARLAEYNLVDYNTGNWTNTSKEKTLFDIHNPLNKYYLGGVGELFLSYQYNNFNIKVGRQMYETPLLNKNKDRLRPNIFQGISTNYKYKRFEFLAAWFISENIRGTFKTYSIKNTYGIYNQGINPFDGTKGSYQNNISSMGVGLLGVKYNYKNWKTQVWNYLGDNVFNLTFLQSDYQTNNEKINAIFGVQGFYETALNNGGNADQNHTYILKGEHTFALGGRIGVGFFQQYELTFNYLGISDKGRHLFPREWGKERFYVSQSRESLEGYGGVNAYVIKYKYETKPKNYSMELGAGIIDQPQITNVSLNKYSLDDYYHFSFKNEYRFQNYLNGLSLSLNVIYTKELNPGSMTATQRINKVDMLNLNFVVDYTF